MRLNAIAAKTFAPLLDERTVMNPWPELLGPWENTVRREGIREWQDVLGRLAQDDPTVNTMKRVSYEINLEPVVHVNGFRKAKKLTPETALKRMVDAMMASTSDPAEGRRRVEEMKREFARILWVGGTNCPLMDEHDRPYDLSSPESRVAVLMFVEDENGHAVTVPLHKVDENGEPLRDPETDEPIENEYGGMLFGDAIFEHLHKAAKEQDAFRVKELADLGKASPVTSAG
jgi:hypothetical protein